jgi:choline monooxygenase
MPAPVLTAPLERYRDPAVYERERARIFACTWQFLGLESDLVRPGDYLAEVIAGYPLVALRDDAGGLRAFHNVCRHRAGPLVAEGKGRCGRELVCRFHEWRYGFDGALREPTGFGPAEGFDPRAFSLFGVRVETWCGMVFVNLDPAAPALAAVVAPLESRFGGWPYRSARLRHRHEMACNWKLHVENYLDGYHSEGVHPGLASEAGAHRHEVTLAGEVALYEVPDRNDAFEGLWAWLWPNFGLTTFRGALMIECMRPEGPGRTVVEHIFLHEPEDPGVDAAIHASERITEEDGWINERVQQNLAAGIFRQGVLSPNQENAVAWFQQRVTRALAE